MVMNSDTEDDERGENTISFTPQRGLGSRPTSSSNTRIQQSLRSRLFGLASVNGSPHKPICTTPGEICAGETETETDEPVSSSTMIHKHDDSNIHHPLL